MKDSDFHLRNAGSKMALGTVASSAANGHSERVGVIDMGSNSVRLVVFDRLSRTPAYYFSEKEICGLGLGMAETGKLSPEGRTKALMAIKRFVMVCDGMGVESLELTATAAMRTASDAKEFAREITRETGLKVNVVNGPTEARLAAQGVLIGTPSANGIVCDIGGSSMELAHIHKGKVKSCETSELGPLQLRSFEKGKERERFIGKGVGGLLDTCGEDHDTLYLVGGSWRALAKLDMKRRGYPLSVLQDYETTTKGLLETLGLIRDGNAGVLRKEAGVSSDRFKLLPDAGEALRGLLKKVKPKRIVLSNYGLREGIFYEMLPDDMLKTDPLIEAASAIEQKQSRKPGNGRKLHEFVSGVCKDFKADPRWIEAACLMHDMAWRTHADMRPELCLDLVTRGTLVGIDHPGRVFLGLALMNRYKNGTPVGRFEKLVELLPDNLVKEARILGQSMRLGAMFAVAGVEHIGELEYSAKSDELSFLVSPEAEVLYTDAAEKRLAAIAKTLGATCEASFEQQPEMRM